MGRSACRVCFPPKASHSKRQASKGSFMFRGFGCVLCVALLWLSGLAPTYAVIKAITPLKVFLEDSNHIVLTKIDALYPEKPAFVLSVLEDLKGKPAYRRLPVVARSDKSAANEDHVPTILKRLAVGKNVILFIKERGKKSTVFGCTDGSWFQLAGERTDDD